MPYKYELTWIKHLKRWRKRFQKKTYYLKTPCELKKDRETYEAALREWDRLKAFLEGFGPSPYTKEGALIPEDVFLKMEELYLPEPPPPTPREITIKAHSRKAAIPQALETANLPAWIDSVGVDAGINPELIVVPAADSPYAGDRRISALADFWLARRRKLTDRGELSLKQWAEDKAKLEVFRKFLRVNFPGVVFIEQIEPSILNLYRDKQWEFVDWPDKEHRISKATLKKRLDAVTKWLTWLVDQNILKELPKDLRTYGRVKLDKPKPVFWTVEECKGLATKASKRTRLYIALALNLGYTQKDIGTLEAEMIDWQTGIVTRDRHKTGVPSKGKLWPSTLKMLQKHRNPDPTGPLLVGTNGLPLYAEKVNEKGNLIVNDSVRLAFNQLKQTKKAGFKEDPRSFKHLRKSAANEIEKVRPELTELFLAHAEAGMKRHYVNQYFDELFAETDKLESLYGF